VASGVESDAADVMAVGGAVAPVLAVIGAAVVAIAVVGAIVEAAAEASVDGLAPPGPLELLQARAAPSAKTANRATN
jgi:hypothetical protein